MKPLGFPKSERLCSKKSIDKIFAQGQSVFSYPIKASFTVEPLELNEPTTQALFVVPKKKFKRAVHRNAIRRRVREAYRLNKSILHDWCTQNQRQIKVAFIYVASEKLSFEQIQTAIVKHFALIIDSQNSNLRWRSSEKHWCLYSRYPLGHTSYLLVHTRTPAAATTPPAPPIASRR